MNGIHFSQYIFNDKKINHNWQTLSVTEAYASRLKNYFSSYFFKGGILKNSSGITFMGLIIYTHYKSLSTSTYIEKNSG